MHELTKQERAESGIENLACQPWQAVHLAEDGKLIRKAIGEHAFHAFIESKNIEWNEYRAQVTKWELDKYLPVL